jgi:2,3-bisphosphoglycerate-independent phosphoglycerate mutase
LSFAVNRNIAAECLLMKYVIVIPDGCADEPMEQLGGRTPLEAAKTPAMDEIARIGVCGQSNNTPAHLPAGSEVANLCLLGYDPDRYFTGRAPLEAAAQGIQLGPHDWAVRCNLVTIENQVMVDFTADHVTTGEAIELLKSLQQAVEAGAIVSSDSSTPASPNALQFTPGVSYRNLLIYRGAADQPAPFSRETRTRAPHDLTDEPVTEDFPRGPGSNLLNELMSLSIDVFANHPVNERRRAAGKKPVTNVWLWGLGGAPSLVPFAERFGIQGVMITAVDLLRGIAALVGWPRIEVAGATGYLDTDYDAKGRAAIEALDHYDLVCVHIEAPDEASHEGRVDAKIEALERIDEAIVGPLLKDLKRRGDFRILVTPDHPTPCSTKKHSHGMVPIAMCGVGITSDTAEGYCEREAEATGLTLAKGWDLMDRFIKVKG